MTEADLVDLVSYHAVTRYVQRIVGVEVPDGAHARHTAELHCEAAGLTIAQVRTLIMTPAVALAAAMGVAQVRTAEFIAHLKPNGVVATIVEREQQRPKLRMTGKREGRRAAHKHRRRNRRAWA